MSHFSKLYGRCFANDGQCQCAAPIISENMKTSHAEKAIMTTSYLYRVGYRDPLATTGSEPLQYRSNKWCI